MDDASNKTKAQGRVGGSGGRRSGRAGNIEYTRVVPKFLRHLVNSEHSQYDTFKPLPGSSRTPKERDSGKDALSSTPGGPSTAELDALRKDGFLVDVAHNVADNDTDSSTPIPVKFTAGANNSKSKSSNVLFPKPLNRHSRNSSMKVAAHRITKNTGQRGARDAFATKNRTKLSFGTNSDSDSGSDED